ncbi:MAG: HEPN domain-containing protein [Ignavibacteriae bacterium]|nr:HEPN domain-containing protein [Ignavibacteriota bacterium]
MSFIDDEFRTLDVLKEAGINRGQCVHAQQLVEKLLKGEFWRRGMRNPWSHDVALLADQLAISLPASRQLSIIVN